VRKKKITKNRDEKKISDSWRGEKDRDEELLNQTIKQVIGGK
jgi:hypothetical protein